MARNRLARIGGAALVAAALSGCTADVTTTVTVHSASSADVHATVTLTGQAAQYVHDHPDVAAGLERDITGRTGTIPARHYSSGTLTYDTAVSYTKLTGAAGVTGVTAASLSGSGTHVTVTVALAPPAQLAAAVRKSVSSQPDAAGLANSILGETSVTVRVVFPGGVSSATGLRAHVSGTTATLSQPVSAFRGGTFAVTGNPNAPTVTAGRVAGAVGVIAVIGAVVWWRRRARGR